jgi:hypothetical protein
VIAKFRDGKPLEAVWNDETKDWVALGWTRCDDPSGEAAGGERA